MKNLLRKEFSLTLHPTCFIFICLAAMMLIPNYPYYVSFFYTTLGIFFTCLNGRENNDIFYSMSLPVAKHDIVKARILLVVILELIQFIACVPFALIRQSFTLVPPNQVGMEANIAFFGFSFIMVGIFNYVFFSSYYKDVTKVGKAFVKGSVFEFIFMMIIETCTHVVPFFRDCLDTTDTHYVGAKLIILFVGIIVYVALTFLVYKKSIKNFEKLDI